MKRHYLHLEESSLQRTVYPLSGITTIGRGSENNIVLADATASRNHARVSFQENSWTVEDLGSINGIIFGDRRMEKIALKPGDTFRIGAASFRFIEKEVSEESNQLSETVEILSAFIEDRTARAEDGRAEARLQRLQDAVAAIPFFSPLEQEERSKLVDDATVHVFNAGEMIMREGDPGRSIYVVLDGRVRVFTRDHHGNELGFAVLGVGQFFGEDSLLKGQPRSKWVAAVDTSVLIELSYTRMQKLVQQHPAVKKLLLKYYRDRREVAKEKRAEAGMEERRRHPRLRERLPANLVVSSMVGPEGETSKSSWKGMSLDISISGTVVGVLRAEQDAFPLGAQVQLEIELPPPWGQVRTVGTIRQVRPCGTEKKITMVGIEFVDTPAAATEKLKGFVHGESDDRL